MTRIRAIEAAIAKREAQAARDNREVVVANQKTAAEILAEDIRKIHSSYRPEALADVLKQKTGSNSNGSSNGHAV